LKIFPLIISFLLAPGLLIGQVQEFKIKEIKEIDTFREHVREIKFSPFGTYITVTSGDNTVSLYNHEYQLLWSSQGDPKNYGGKCAFSPDGKYLAFTRYKSRGDTGILNIENLRVVQSLDGHPYWVNCIAYSPDGNFIATGGSEKQVIIWEWDGKEFIKKHVFKDHQKPVTEVMFSRGELYLASASEDKTVIVRKLEKKSFEIFQVLPEQKYFIHSIAFSPDGKLLASGTEEKITIWKLDNNKFIEEKIIRHHSGRVWSLDFSPDSQFLAAALSKGTVKIWHYHGGQWAEMHTIYRHKDNVFDATFSPDGKFLATASSDKTAIFWRLEGVGSDPIVLLMSYLGILFTAAQRLIVDQITSRRLLTELDEDLTAPRDEFETAEEYNDRKNKLRAHVLFKIQELIEEHFDVKEKYKKKNTFEVTINDLKLESFNADSGIYTMEFLGTGGYLKIPASEAKNLKKNSKKAFILGIKELSKDSISYDYHGFVLVHPVTGKNYDISMEENPFRGSKRKELPPVKKSPKLSGPNIDIDTVRFGSIFPVFYKYYDENPIGKAVLFNNGTAAVEDIRVSLFIKQYMDNPKLCKAPERLDPGERKEIELYSLFTDKVLEISEGDKVSFKITVDYSSEGKRYSKEFLDTIRLYNRNAVVWDDDRKVAAFVTAKDPAVLKFSKNIAGMIQSKASKALNPNLLMGIGMYEALNLFGISYVVDPVTPYKKFSQNLSVDFLQFPNQTLEYKAGDCDDLSILYNALLESVGIKTAFITIPGHIFTAFSLDLKAGEAKKQFLSEEDFIFMDDDTWLPVEITVTGEGFLKAWKTGADEWRTYFEKGQAAFYPTEKAWEIYEPVGFKGTADITPPPGDLTVKNYLAELRKLIDREIHSRVQYLKTEIQKNRGSLKLRNRLGVLYARYGLEEEAIEEFKKTLIREDYLPALVNIGHVHFLKNNLDAALAYYERALKKDSDNARVLLYLTKVNHKMGNYDGAIQTYKKLKMIDPDLARPFSYLDTKSKDEGRASITESVNEIIVWEE